MDISRLMVYTQKIKESKLKETNREVKKRLELMIGTQGRPIFPQKFSGQGSSNNHSNLNLERVSNPKLQGGNDGGSSFSRSTYAKYGKKHDNKCLAVTDGCFS